MLTRTAGVELGLDGVLVVGVGPGAVETPINTATMGTPAAGGEARLGHPRRTGWRSRRRSPAWWRSLAGPGASYVTATTVFAMVKHHAVEPRTVTAVGSGRRRSTGSSPRSGPGSTGPCSVGCREPLRFDLTGRRTLRRWYVTHAPTAPVEASHRGPRADTVVRIDEDLLGADRRGDGERHGVPAPRGTVAIEGDLHLMMVFQKVFPGLPRSSTGPSRTRFEGRVVTERSGR